MYLEKCRNDKENRDIKAKPKILEKSNPKIDERGPTEYMYMYILSGYIIHCNFMHGCTKWQPSRRVVIIVVLCHWRYVSHPFDLMIWRCTIDRICLHQDVDFAKKNIWTLNHTWKKYVLTVLVTGKKRCWDVCLPDSSKGANLSSNS